MNICPTSPGPILAAGETICSPRSKSRRRQHGGTLLGLALGLVVGVLISFGVVWLLNKTPIPFVEKAFHPDQAQDSGADAKTPLILPGKPGDKPIERSGERKFDFYDILEGKQNATPSGAPPPPTAAVVVTDTAGGTLYLQAGAFKKLEDAENLKARIAMQGFEANVLKVEVPDKGTMHRVRLGPYDSAEAMNRARGQLSQNGIPATVVLVKD